MYALYRAQLIGFLTDTPQIRQTPAGQTVGDLNIMTRASFINSSGQTQLQLYPEYSRAPIFLYHQGLILH